MEMRMFVGGLAAVLGACCVSYALLAFVGSLRRRRIAMAVQGESSSLQGVLGWRLHNGVALTRPLAAWLLKGKRVRAFADELVNACAARGIVATGESALSVALGALIVLVVIVGVLLKSLVAAFALALCVVAVAVVLAGSARDKREEAIREEVPNALESMSACFGSGFTLLQTFEQVAKEIPGSLGDVFQNCAHILETGGSAERALNELRQGAHASELAFVAVALDVQHQNGGALKQVLEAASDSVKGELELRRSLRVQTAQAKLSARVVVVMPFVLIAAFSLASPDFLSPFFSSVAGYALLGLAALMQAGGIVLVHRALSVDGVS